MIDIVLLRILKDRNYLMSLVDMLPAPPTLDAKTVAIAQDFKRYFAAYPSHATIDWITFIPEFQRWHPGMKQEDFNVYTKIFGNLQPNADDDQRRNIMEWLADQEMMTKLGNIVHKHAEGDIPDAFGAVVQVQDLYRQRTGFKEVSFIKDDIGDLLQQEFNDVGVSWRLRCLNQSMRRLRPGDFGIIAGRPDKGKTSFIASECTWMAPQLPPSKNILWLNNEGMGTRIVPRLYQAALNLTMTQLKEAHSAGSLIEQYKSSIGGRLDKFRVFDIHGYSNTQVERIIEDNDPGIVIYDMIDNIRGFGGEARTDLALEAMYQWARERSVKHSCIGLATSQISNDGDGLQFPTLGMLKDSKTGKQGACDFQLMIGASNDPVLAGSRYISLPKNKLRRPDGASDPRAEVIFNGLTSRYEDIQGEYE